MNPPPADILDRCLEEACAGRDPETILRDYPAEAEAVRPLVRLAQELAALPDPSVSTGGVLRLLARLAAEQARPVHPATRRKIRLLSGPVLARVAGILLAVLLAGWWTSTAASGSVPGDLLYPVKMLTEKIHFWLAIGAEDRVELRIRFSEKRLQEVVKKWRRGDGLDQELLHAMLAEADRALERSPHLPEASRALALSRIALLTALQKETLEGLVPEAPPDQREILASFIQMCDHRCRCARGAAPGPPGPLPAPPDPAAAPAPDCPMCR